MGTVVVQWQPRSWSFVSGATYFRRTERVFADIV